MKTAAEWVEHMRETGHFYCESEGAATLAADIRARDNEVLEAAAARACRCCEQRVPLIAQGSNAWFFVVAKRGAGKMRFWHEGIGSAPPSVCQAASTQDLIAEIKRQANG